MRALGHDAIEDSLHYMTIKLDNADKLQNINGDLMSFERLMISTNISPEVGVASEC